MKEGPQHRRAANRHDKSTLSNYEMIYTKHVDFRLSVDFDKKELDGWVEHHLVVANTSVKVAIFDSFDIKVKKVEVNGEPGSFRYLAKHAIFGTPIEIPLDTKTSKITTSLKEKETIIIRIHYTTSPAASACQWLPPEQTAGKKYPYLFTQSQAIHARSIFPCQDAPAIKMTYTAKIRVPNWATALMSALRNEEEEFMDGSGCKTFVWEQPVTMPSYLVALAVGDLESRSISPRCQVWAEPSVVEAAAFEFAQTEEFLQHAEALTSVPYVWTRYDILCLPPSFPYGGMENPCLTFATPTLLAGDRSLADVIAHEIAHSWSGNLVTNQTWEHFWLNEGWTMWIQRKVMTRIHKDPLFFDLDAEWVGWPHLEESITAFQDHAEELTALVPEISEVDPDDAFSSVPYEKGFSLLVLLEQLVGSQEFAAFAQHYIKTYQYRTVTSEDFRSTLLEYFDRDPRLLDLPWDDLFYQPGLPPKPKYNAGRLAKPSVSLADEWYEKGRDKAKKLTAAGSSSNGGGSGRGQEAQTFAGWSTLQKQIFLERLLSRAEKEGVMAVPVLEAMDMVYLLSSSKNSEIRFRWCILCIRAGAKFIVSNVLDFVTAQGRMKFTRPLYKEMFKSAMAKELAIETFKKHASFYHPICRKMVAADLGLKVDLDGTISPAPISSKATAVKPAAPVTSSNNSAQAPVFAPTPAPALSPSKDEEERAKGAPSCPLSKNAQTIVLVGTGLAFLAGVGFVMLRAAKNQRR